MPVGLFISQAHLGHELVGVAFSATIEPFSSHIFKQLVLVGAVCLEDATAVVVGKVDAGYF